MRTNGIVTIFKKDSIGETFVKMASVPAWIHKSERIRSTANGVYRRDSFDVRIDLGLAEKISVEDLIFFGKLDVENFSAAKCRRIAVVTKNQSGQSPHWHLQAEYEYM